MIRQQKTKRENGYFNIYMLQIKIKITKQVKKDIT